MGFREYENLYLLKRDIDHLLESLNDYEPSDVETWAFIDNLKTSANDIQKQVVTQLIDVLKKGN